ncbi:MAG: hypothetical protein ACRDZY_02220 [Acidimicrobiales bacterium]
MVFLRDGVEEIHEFVARPALGWQDLQRLIPLVIGKTAQALSAKALASIDRLLRRVLTNDDGTPLNWSPTVVDGHFTDPNGDHTPADLLPAYEAFEAGSSRRRWVHLMDFDDELTIEYEQILGLVNDLIEVAADRPLPSAVPSVPSRATGH